MVNLHERVTIEPFSPRARSRISLSFLSRAMKEPALSIRMIKKVQNKQTHKISNECSRPDEVLVYFSEQSISQPVNLAVLAFHKLNEFTCVNGIVLTTLEIDVLSPRSCCSMGSTTAALPLQSASALAWR